MKAYKGKPEHRFLVKDKYPRLRWKKRIDSRGNLGWYARVSRSDPLRYITITQLPGMDIYQVTITFRINDYIGGEWDFYKERGYRYRDGCQSANNWHKKIGELLYAYFFLTATEAELPDYIEFEPKLEPEWNYEGVK